MGENQNHAVFCFCMFTHFFPLHAVIFINLGVYHFSLSSLHKSLCIKLFTENVLYIDIHGSSGFTRMLNQELLDYVMIYIEIREIGHTAQP